LKHFSFQQKITGKQTAQQEAKIKCRW